MQHEQEARHDLEDLRAYVKTAPKRVSVPEGSVPGEVLFLVLCPNSRMNTSRWGLGRAKKARFAPVRTWRLLNQAYVLIHRSRLTPLKWHRSEGVALKKNSSSGP